jgi:hypothetical protein
MHGILSAAEMRQIASVLLFAADECDDLLCSDAEAGQPVGCQTCASYLVPYTSAPCCTCEETNLEGTVYRNWSTVQSEDKATEQCDAHS